MAGTLDFVMAPGGASDLTEVVISDVRLEKRRQGEDGLPRRTLADGTGSNPAAGLQHRVQVDL